MKINKLTDELEQIEDQPIPDDIKKQTDGFDSELNDLISSMLTDSHPETNKDSHQDVFGYLMKERSTAIEYITNLIAYNMFDNDASFYAFYGLIFDLFHTYSDYFNEALARSFAVSPNGKMLIKKAKIEKLPKSISGNSLISKLFEIGNFQSFVYLKNIAECFPFLFSDFLPQLFELVLPEYENTKLIFSIQNENEIDDLKRSISCLYFFQSCLYSVEVFNSFIDWFFNKITTLSDSQIYSFLIILNSLFETRMIDMIMLMYSIKYNIINTMTLLLKREIKGCELFEKSFKTFIYNLLSHYYRLLLKIRENSNKIDRSYHCGDHFPIISEYLSYPIFIDQYIHLENPLELIFDGSLVIKKEFSPLKIPFPKNKEIFNDIINFSNYVNKHNQFSIISSKYNNIQFADEFKQKAKQVCVKSNERCSIYFYAEQYSVNILRFIVSHPMWVVNWILKNIFFSTLPEHEEILLNAQKTFKILVEKTKKSDDADDQTFDFDLEDFIFSQYCQPMLFRRLVFEASVNGYDTSLCELFREITKNQVALLSFLQFFSQTILIVYNNSDVFSSSKTIENLMNVISYISANEGFNENFIDVCGKKIFKIVLSPNYRTNSFFLSRISSSFCSLNLEVPSCISHFIGFILASDQRETIPIALNLYEKLDENDTKNLNKIVSYSFEQETNNKDPSYVNIQHFLERVPNIAKQNRTRLYQLIDICILRYTEKRDLNILNLICTLFNYLTPKRKNSEALIVSDSNALDFSKSLTVDSAKLLTSSGEHDSVLMPAPQILVDSSPKFWRIYEKYRHFISNLIQEDIKIFGKFQFLVDYYELVIFRVRSNYFRDLIKSKLNKNKTTQIVVSRDTILVDSFNVFSNLQTDQILNKFSVCFKGEKGYDAGGLTREWFNLIVKKIFDPSVALFEYTNKQTLIPSSHSYVVENYIEYFRFAGIIVARSLIEGQTINAHLTMSFLRQILHRSPKLKDIEDYDEVLFNSFEYFINNDIDPLEMRFEIDVDDLGEEKTIQLIENGENIPVTNENKKEFITLYACYHLNKLIIKQINAFRSGFDSLIPPNLIKMFSPSELDLLICGVPQVDINDLMANTVYGYPYNADHPVIKMFFNVLSSWENDKLGKFLLFLTGSSQVPLNGFKEYKDRNIPIKIQRSGNKNAFPSSHTCFNTLDLPEYGDENEMNDKLMEAIQVQEFGFL